MPYLLERWQRMRRKGSGGPGFLYGGVISAAAIAAFVAGCSKSRDTFSRPVPEVTPLVLRVVPHDTLAFTQGLLYAAGRLYESTGAPGERLSSLRVIDAAEGRLVRALTVPDVFAEGIAVLGNRLVQLTWRNGIALVYSFPGLERTETVYEYPGEGWGLATDGAQFFMSDGSDTVRVLDSGFRLKRKFAVRMADVPVRSLNELEYARGLLYANIWYSTIIVAIDPGNGRVVCRIDCESLWRWAVGGSIDRVLNGIAYDSTRDVFFLTGKDWPLIFEVRIPTAPSTVR